MIKRNLLSFFHLVRNVAAHHRKAWLPYGVILLCLAGIWWGWDGVPAGRQEIIRETKNGRHSSPPVFSAFSQDEKENDSAGRLVVSAAPSLRRRPLPDLFAGSAPKSAAEPAAVVQEVPVPPAEMRPVLCGTMEYGGAYLAFLQHGGKTLVCSAGDTFDGYTVVSVHRHGVQLEKGGIWTMVNL